MEAKIIEAAVFEKLADEVEKRVSRKYEIRLQKLESKYEKRFRQLKQYICQLEQKLTRTSRQNDDTRVAAGAGSPPTSTDGGETVDTNHTPPRPYVASGNRAVSSSSSPLVTPSHLETESPNVGGACLLPISKSEDGFMWVKRRAYKLHAKYTFYSIVLLTDPTKRSDDVDVPNDLRAELVLGRGRVFEFSRVEPNNTQKPTFTVEAATDSNASGRKGCLKWRLKFHNLRTYWNQEWKDIKSAWLKIVVDRNCWLNINMTYDKEKRVQSKKKLYEQKKREKKDALAETLAIHNKPSFNSRMAIAHMEPSVSVPAAIAHANAVAAPVSASVSIGQTNAANSNPNQLGGVITRPYNAELTQTFPPFPSSSRDSSASTTAADSLDLRDDFDPLNPDPFDSLDSDSLDGFFFATSRQDSFSSNCSTPAQLASANSDDSQYASSAQHTREKSNTPAGSVMKNPEPLHLSGPKSLSSSSTPPSASFAYHTPVKRDAPLTEGDRGSSTTKRHKPCKHVLEMTTEPGLVTSTIQDIKAVMPHEVQSMLAIAAKHKQIAADLNCQWVSPDKLGRCACEHVFAMAKAMVHLIVCRFRTADSTTADSLTIEEVWSGSAFMLCGKRKLAITAKHNVEGVDQRGQGVLFACTHPQDDAAPHSGEHFATVVDFVGDTAVLELHALHPDSATDAPPLHAARLAEVSPRQGDKIRVVGIASIKGGDSAIRVLALTPGTVASTGYREDGLVPCDLTMFEGLSGGAMTTENGCVVALAEGVDSHSGRMAFATDLVGLRGGLEDMLRNRYNCGIEDLVTDGPVSWAFTETQKEEMDDRIDARVRKHSLTRSARVSAGADILRARIQRRVYEAHSHFTGRDWLAKQLVESLGRLAPQKAILITGTGGTGKSFFFDRLVDPVVCTNLGGDWSWLHRRILARHCCMYKFSDSLDARGFLDSLVDQLLNAMKDVGRTFTLDDEDKTLVNKLLFDHLETPKHTEASAIVAEVLLPALKAVGDSKALGGRCVILVDSLDEAQCGGNIVGTLVHLIQKSPQWLQWVATSRPDAAVRQDIKPVEGGCIELLLEGAKQEADVREYVETLLLPMYPSVARLLGIRMRATQQVDAICKKARAVFKYAAMAVQKLKDDPDTDPKSLPDTLDELYLSSFERKYKAKLDEFTTYAAPMLATLVASRDALPVDLVRGDKPTSRAEWPKQRKHLQFVQRTICERSLLGENQQLMQFGHKTFVDFLRNPKKANDFVVHAGHGHALLAERCGRVLGLRSDASDLCMRYSLRHLVHHLCYLHEHRPHLHPDVHARPYPLEQAARVVLSFDWLLGRVMLDKTTKGVLADGEKVISMLRTRSGVDDAELRGCIEDVMKMAKRATRAVIHDPHQILGRIVFHLIDHTAAPVVELVRRAREHKSFQWWSLSGNALTRAGSGDEPLARIGDCAFEGCDGITSLTFPSGIASIGDKAFSRCRGITSLTLPNDLTSLGQEAFSGCCAITALTLPDGLASIGDKAFSRCRAITSLTLPKKLTSIGQEAFSGCCAITALTLPDGLTSIGDWAFDECGGVTALTFPDGLASIGDGAFSRCGRITSLTLPEGLISIGYGAFSGCADITSLTLPDGLISIGDQAFSRCGGITSLALSKGLTSIGHRAFFGCVKITSSLSLPHDLTSIGYGAFFGCAGITSLTLPRGLTGISKQAFSCCGGITAITFPCGLTSIGYGAFSGCVGITAVTLPEGLTSIGQEAFSGCVAITSLSLPDGLTVIGKKAFSGCVGITSLTLPEGLTNIGDGAFSNCDGITSLTLPDGLTNICRLAFRGCGGITDLTLPDGLTGIGEKAFSGCVGITSLTLPDGLTGIGAGTFRNCGGITSLTLPAGLKSVGEKAFYNCSGITALTLPDVLTSIGEKAFYGCVRITSLTLSDGLTSIGHRAFFGCGDITSSLTFPGGLTSIGNGAFSGCGRITSLALPDGLTNIGYGAFSLCGGITSLTLPYGFTSIGNGAFSGCSGITSLTLREGLTSIGNGAFCGCSGIPSLTLPNSLTSIADDAFVGCGLTIMRQISEWRKNH